MAEMWPCLGHPVVVSVFFLAELKMPQIAVQPWSSRGPPAHHDGVTNSLRVSSTMNSCCSRQDLIHSLSWVTGRRPCSWVCSKTLYLLNSQRARAHVESLGHSARLFPGMAEAPEPESSLSGLHSPSPLLPHSLAVFHGYSLRLLILSWSCSLCGLCSVTLGV